MSGHQDVRISYIIATRNRAHWLEKTLANVREFITPADELIVVDGGSSDTTASVARVNNDIISRFLSEPDFGEAHAFNKGFLLARGEIIKVLTDDDYFYPDAMLIAAKTLVLDSSIDALICGGEAYRTDMSEAGESFHSFRYLGSEEGITFQSFRTKIICGLGLWLRRSVIARVGLFDTSFLAVDTNYVSRLFLSNINVKYLNVKLFRHLTHEQSLSGNHNLDRFLRDEIRILLDRGTWAPLSQYSSEVVRKTLGLNAEVNGAAMTDAIRTIDQIRGRYPRVMLLAVVALKGALRFCQLITGVFGRVRRIVTRTSTSTVEVTNNKEEPKWDGSLR